MDFGVVLQNDPPAARVVELARQAELLGFTHVWTFDSHLLWQEPYVVYSQILANTRKVMVGPMVTNPATRDWTVTASLFATLNEMFGNRTICGIGRGDSAVRVTNGKPVTLATLRESIEVIRALANGEQADYKGNQLRFPWSAGSRLPIWVAAYGPKALALAGEVADGFILQLADPTSPSGRSPRCARPRPTPGATRTRSRSAWPRRPTSPTAPTPGLAHGRDQCRWFGGMVGNHVADIVARYGADAGGAASRAALTRLHRRARRATTTTRTARPATRTPTSCPTRSSTGSA